MPCSPRLTTLTAAVGVSALCLALSACGQPASTASASSAPSASGPPVQALAPSPLAAIGTSTDAELPASVLDLPLVDASGRPHPLSSFAGKILVISDTMTLCQETCPIDTASVVQTARAAAQAGLNGQVEFVSITVDPQRDQGAQLKAYNALFAPAPESWTSLTGPPAAIKTLWDRLGVYREKVAQDNPPPKNWRTGNPLTYDIEHSDEVFFLDARQHERFVIEGPPHLSGKNALPATLDTFMDDDGHHSLAHPDPTDWTPPQAITVIDWLRANA
ncbi:hypothetical protein BA895_01755 [Humibacillus sp. DSM 29435]|uniref:SCO family protein n=1 Tax=Humibacillus sp. DSM 29435 TaxID=1869167 RepID=UPI000872C2FB|nr:SCO family protein [Humibacillus sp. DSM 29435]OFE18912.1 hypothetical protein BA895_01755 [Humibacillus sp. DSM 29435]